MTYHKISDTAENETRDSADKDKDMNIIIHTHQQVHKTNVIS